MGMAKIKHSKTPLHIQIQQHLLELIKNRTFAPGDQLPAEVELAEQLGVSRSTLREALMRLEQDGIISRKHGLGTFVSFCAHPIIESGLEVLESLEHQARRIGLNTQMTHLEVVERPAEREEREKLAFPPEASGDVLCVDRVIIVENTPIAYLRDVLPRDLLCPDDLGKEFSGSVLDLLLQRGLPAPVISHTEIVAEGANPYVASRLDIPQGSPLLKLIAQLYAHDEQVLDYSLSYFVPGYFRFHVMRRVGMG